MNFETQEIQVSIPRSKLQGNPTRWGYLVLTLAVHTDSTKDPYFKPLPGDGGTPILGLLASLETQKKLLRSSTGRYSKLKCVRLP